MSGKIPQHIPNPQEFGSGAPTEAAAMDTRTANESLHDGLRQLAGNIVKVAETGDPNAVMTYLGDVLADTEQRVPGVERMAAFEFLAHEQRSEIRRDLVVSGREMLDAFGTNSQRAREGLRQTARQAANGARATIEAHEQQVGRYFRSGVDTRRAAQGHDATVQVGQRGFGALATHVRTLGAWTKAQVEVANVYETRVRQGEDHERALHEASEVVKPDYTGEQKDLSVVIRDKVKEAAATKLQSAIAEAQASGKSPEEAVFALISSEQGPDTTKPEFIQELRAFAAEYAQSIQRRDGTVESASKESEGLLRRFAARGREGYQYARRVEDAAELYQQQRRTINQFAENTGTVIQQSASVLDTHNQELQRMRQKVASVEASPRPAE